MIDSIRWFVDKTSGAWVLQALDPVTNTWKKVPVVFKDDKAPHDHQPADKRRWFYEASPDNAHDLRKQFAIVDDEGFVIVGMAHMSEAIAVEIVRNHNATLEN